MRLYILFLLAALNGPVDQQPTNGMKITSILLAQKSMADQKPVADQAINQMKLTLI